MQKYALTAIFALILMVAAACGSSGRGGFVDDPNKAGKDPSIGGPGSIAEEGATLEIEPLDSSLSLDETNPTPSLDYKATLVHKDKTREDVSKEGVFKVDQGAFATAFGTFAGSKFTADPNGVGKSQIKVEARGLSATTSLTLRLKKIMIG